MKYNTKTATFETAKVEEFIKKLIADEYINWSGEAIKRIRELAEEIFGIKKEVHDGED